MSRVQSPEGAFVVHKIQTDGNCLFRALSFLLWGSEDEYMSLRLMIADYGMQHWLKYGCAIMAEWNVEDPMVYHMMTREGRFASELECTLAADMYDLNISIYKRINKCRVQRVFHHSVNSCGEHISLVFSAKAGRGHYDVLIPA